MIFDDGVLFYDKNEGENKEIYILLIKTKI